MGNKQTPAEQVIESLKLAFEAAGFKFTALFNPDVLKRSESFSIKKEALKSEFEIKAKKHSVWSRIYTGSDEMNVTMRHKGGDLVETFPFGCVFKDDTGQQRAEDAQYFVEIATKAWQEQHRSLQA